MIVFGAPVWVFVLTTPAALIGLAAMHTSRWYVNAGFTTFLVIVLLTYGESSSVSHFFYERTAETLVGVGIAYFFGLVIPQIRSRQGALRRCS